MVWWEIVFMLVVLKIPLVYLCLVVWWAIRAEPIPGGGPEPLPVGMPLDEGPRRWWRAQRRRPRPGPHGSPVRGGRTPAQSAAAQGRLER